MSKNTKRIVDDIGKYYLSYFTLKKYFKLNILLFIIEFDSSSIKRICRNITCLFDLPDEILLFICRYLSPALVLYSFYTPLRPEMRLHRIILNYYTKIKLGGISNNEYIYLLNLLSDRKISLRPESLILSNEHVTSLTHRYFNSTDINTINSIFVNLRSLTLIDCSSVDLDTVGKFYFDMTQMQYLHITFRMIDDISKYNGEI